MKDIHVRVKKILDELEQTNEDLLALADDIWLSIDHNDNDSLQEGVAFKKEYNEKVTAFDRLSGELSQLVQSYMGISLEIEEESTTDYSENQRIIKALDKREKHYLNEDFTYKIPFGFSIEGKGFKGVDKWKQMYLITLRYLFDTKRDFTDVLNAKEFVSNRGNRDFSTNPAEMRSAKLIANDIYAETNLSAKSITERLIKLMDYFSIDRKEFIIYLQEDRDWRQ